jgi:hypothetical protein
MKNRLKCVQQSTVESFKLINEEVQLLWDVNMFPQERKAFLNTVLMHACCSATIVVPLQRDTPYGQTFYMITFSIIITCLM